MSVRAVLGAAAAVIVSAVAFALYARVEWPWLMLGWVGLVPWLWVLDRTSSWRHTLATGLLMPVAFVLALFGWFARAMQNYSGAPWGVALLILVVVAPLMEPQFVVYALVRRQLRRNAGAVWRMAIGAAGAYVATEWAWPKLFRDTLGQGLYASVLMRQAADLAGTHGLTFVLLVANECVLAVIGALAASATARQRMRRAYAPAACIVVLVIALLAYGSVRIRQVRNAPSSGALTAAVVQANISQYGRLAAELGTFDAVKLILDAHFALSTQALTQGHVDLLVWPETVYPTTFGTPKSEDGAAFDRTIAAFVTATGIPLVFGAYDVDGRDEFNAAFLLKPAADGQRVFQTYRKASLFPFTEQVPAMFDSAFVRRWLPWLGTWKPGSGRNVLTVSLPGGRALRIAPLICYDALDPSLAIAAVRQGAEVLVTLSNDSWFAYDGTQRLILLISAFRSIETRRPQVRAANTGISAVITSTGDYIATIPADTRAALVGTVKPEQQAMTLMLAWGDWFPPVALVAAIVLCAFSAIARRRLR